jgi:phenylalanyl-tRNA synthetase beta chain
MLVSRNALAKLVNLTNVSDEQLTTLFNNYGGLEVEAVYPVIPPNNYVIGHIKEVRKHPNADTLNVTQVDVGTEILEIVCGAPNVALGQYVIVARVGTTMPNGMEIAAREVRGVMSNGMICSLGEIGVNTKYLTKEDEAGIYVFDQTEALTVGADALAALDLNSVMFDLSITPNRADCLNYRGLAYEVAALTEHRLAADTFDYRLPAGTFSITEYVDELQVPSTHVQTYNLIAYKNVVIKPAPQWMQSFLIAHDVRPINNVVDITNYVMLQLGLPLHAFDAAKLPTQQIIVRQAKDKETLITLDDKTRVLSRDDVVISTGTDAIALAGVMGGAETEVDNTTTSIVLEAAIFDARSVRKTSLQYDLRSEASLRMEKLLDPSLPQRALALASELIVQYAHADVSTDVLSFTKDEQVTPIVIEATYERIIAHIGAPITPTEIDTILERLSFPYTKTANGVSLTPPTWRPDIRIFEDIVEEVARLYGLENIPNVLPVDVARPVFRTDKARFLDTVHTTLQALGLQEAITYTLESREQATLGAYETTLTPINILYPLNNDRQTLRTTTYYSMIETLQYHYNHSFAKSAFYELTDVYGRVNDSNESARVLALGGYGTIEDQPLYELKTAIDFPLLKTWFERLLPSTQIRLLSYRRTGNTLFHPGLSADIYYKETYVGTFGKIHPQTAKNLDVHPELYLGEIRIDTVYHLIANAKKTDSSSYTPVSKFPSMSRDLTVLAPRSLPAHELVTCTWKYAGDYAQDVQILDVYTGEHIEATHKSVTLNLVFNSKSSTLTNEAITQQMDAILKGLSTELNVTLRT